MPWCSNYDYLHPANITPMHKIIIPLLAIILAACSASGNKELGTVNPSTSDTITKALSDEAKAVTSAEVVIGDTSNLTARFDEISEANATASEHYYTVSITTKQYEASSDVTWYFDHTFLPRYFSMSWASEGNEGSTEYFIEQNEVICARVEEYNQTHQWCNTTGGTRTTWDESTDTGSTELLEPDFAATCDENLERYMSTLTAILNEGEITSKDENEYTIRIEKTAEVGIEVTEYTEVKIPKKLYESIKGE
jgi:hypothetical protein